MRPGLRQYPRRLYFCGVPAGLAEERARKRGLRPWSVRVINGLKVQFYQTDGHVIVGFVLGHSRQPGRTHKRPEGCGCGQRAQKVLDYLGVEMDADYVQEHHFKATLKAILIRLRRAIWPNTST